jgi:subtilisin
MLMFRAVAVAVLLVTFAGTTPALGANAGVQPTMRWIVQLAASADATSVIETARARFGATIGQRFGKVLNGFAVQMTSSQRDELIADPRVLAIVPDMPIHATGDPYPTTDSEVQPGIRRVGALANPDRDDAHLDVDIAILDTGIQPTNAELNIVGGYNCTDPSRPDVWADSAGFGHGTHVSGIAAAIQNGRGVAGVAQGARLWAIKVLDGSGNGYWSWVICGLERVAAMRDPNNTAVPRIEVVNMSIASPGWDDGDCGRSNADLLHHAVCRVYDAGVTMVAAAGNEHSDAAGYVPGAYDEVITVAAMADWNGAAAGSGTPPPGCSHTEADDAFAKFSDYGADVDVIAPGVCVLSLLPVDRLGLMSGTSMATPHVTGGAALYFLEEARRGRPRPTPEQVRAALMTSGTVDWQVSTDADRNQPGSVREPALNVSDFSMAQSFRIGTRRAIVRAGAGSSVHNDLWVARLGGFTGGLDWHVDSATLPARSNASLGSGPSLTIDLAGGAPAGSYTVRISASSGAEIERAAFRLIVPTTTADIGGPTVKLTVGKVAGSISVPVSVAWTRVTNARRYRLQTRVDEGAWGSGVRTTRTQLTLSERPGRRYQFRVQALVGGVWRSWKQGRTALVTAVEPSNDVAFTGNWKAAPSRRAYSELPVSSSEAGASATYRFTARSIAWLSVRAPERGRATVYIDGVASQTVDLYASTRKDRVIVFARSFAGSGAHAIRIVVSGAPADRPRVDLDALIVVSD